MPVLSRIDVVEREAPTWVKPTPPTSDDLKPGALQYQLAAGDELRIEVFELVTQGQTDVAVRSIDQSGNIRLPTVGELPAAGLTVGQVQKEIEDRLRGFITDPIVNVVLERGGGFSFIIYGAVSNTGVYGLSRPDFHLMEAIALAGGTFSVTQKVFVIRSAALDPSVEPEYFNRGVGRSSSGSMSSDGIGPTGTAPGTTPPDIDELINRLPDARPDAGTTPKPNPTPPADPSVPEKPQPSLGAFGPSRNASQNGVQTGAPTKPPVDVDELGADKPPVSKGIAPTAGGGWSWDAAKQEWVRTASGASDATGRTSTGGATTPGGTALGPLAAPERMYATRVIEIDYQALARGESNLNVIIRPGDSIYVDSPLSGVVYVGGEISRPGVYELPSAGRLTLSRLIDAAGGLGQIAIPSRVDLIRSVGPGREAAIRVNLAAIRNRQEPDIAMKPDDHIIIGTNFFATPLAVIRNGFRMSYGFGFLLDRNFGNDVFGAPPTNILGN